MAEAGLEDRIHVEESEIGTIDRSVGAFDVAYFQYALHQLADPIAAVRAGWDALRPGGRLLILEWCAPDGPDEYRTLYGQLVAGIQLDETFQGTRLRTVREFQALAAEAGLPGLDEIDLPSGATLLQATRPI